MSSQQLDEEAIFHVARELQNSETRSRYLDQVCAGDQQLRERVEALLDVHEKESEFLKSSPEAVPTVDHAPMTEAPGTTIGRYHLREQIGEGGMGSVFVAEQERPIRRKVALKVIKPGMDSKSVIARFEAERQALALMDHPNIAKVLDAGTTDSGRPYFVMELVRGIPITEYCDEHKLTVAERLELFTHVCKAIQHAHQKAIIHRDIKPSNVLVTEQDGKAVPKVIDFGVAKALNQRLTDRTIYTSFAQVVGTPLYMSPEQAALSAVDVDTRSDVYSLGVLLYELLTGTTPFDRKRFEQAAYDEIRRIVREEEPPKASTRICSLGVTANTVAKHRKTDLHGLQKAVSGELDWIMMKSLEKERARRYETAAGLAEDIRRFVDDKPVSACPPSSWYHFRKLVKRCRTAAAVIAAMLTVLLVGIVITTCGFVLYKSLASQLEQTVIAERDARTKAQRATAEARAEAERRRRLQYVADMNAAAAAFEENDFERVDDLLRRHSSKTEQTDLRGYEWRCLRGVTGRVRRAQRVPMNDNVLALAFSPDGRELAVGHGGSSMSLLDVLTGEQCSYGNRDRWGTFVGYASAGKRLIHPGAQGNVVNVWDREADETLSLKHSAIVWNAAAVSHNLLATGDNNGSVTIWNVETCELLHQFQTEFTTRSVALSRDGNRLAAGDTNGRIMVWDLTSEDVAWKWVQKDERSVEAVSFSTDGELLAAGTVAGSVLLLDADEGVLKARLRGHADDVRSVAFSPTDSNLLASASRDGTVRLWNLSDYSERAILRGAWVGRALAFSPDGRRIAASGWRDVLLWDLATEKMIDALKAGIVADLQFFPDGRTFVSRTHDWAGGEVNIWNVEQRVTHGSVFSDAIACSVDISNSGMLAAATLAGDVRLWNSHTAHEEPRISTKLESIVTAIQFLPGGERLALGTLKGQVALWDGSLRRLGTATEAHEAEVTSLLILPTLGLLASASWDHTIKLWDIESGKLCRTLYGHTDWVASLAASADGSLLVSGAWDGTIRLWDTATWEDRVITGDASGMLSVHVMADGRTLVTGSGLNRVKFWDATTGEQLLRLRAHDGAVYSAAFSPTEDLLVTCGGEYIRFWPMSQPGGLTD